MQLAFRIIGSKDEIEQNREDRTMKRTILAALVALTAGTAVVGPAAAASLTITTGDSARVYDRYDDGDRYDNGRYYMRHRHGWRHGMTYRRAYRECEVTTTRHWRHGRMIVERTRVCD
jgi:hypothetical protein